jgi:hypothetical protein
MRSIGVSHKLWTTQELEYFFFCRAKREIFFQNFTLGYMTKTLNQNIFLEKNHNTPLQVKWSFPY